MLLHYAAMSTEGFFGVLPGWLSGLLAMGYLGVDFFFVLSGFIIMNAHMGDAWKLASGRHYIGKRLWRIYPPYFAGITGLDCRLGNVAIALRRGRGFSLWRAHYSCCRARTLQRCLWRGR